MYIPGYIPFLQIHEEHHKPHIKIPRSDSTKIFFKSKEARDKIGERLGDTSKEMSLRVARANYALAKLGPDEDEDSILEEIQCNEVENPKVAPIDEYAPDLYGIAVSCRVVWEGLVVPSDISRPSGSVYSIGRKSQPAFQGTFIGLNIHLSVDLLPVNLLI